MAILRWLSCFVVQNHQSDPYRLSILVSCTWKWGHRSLAQWRTKTRHLETSVLSKLQVEAEHSHGSCKGILGVLDCQRVWHCLTLAFRGTHLRCWMLFYENVGFWQWHHRVTNLLSCLNPVSFLCSFMNDDAIFSSWCFAMICCQISNSLFSSITPEVLFK